jgi:alkanesulfonate monooxygenase SsuD/methylene tetrahydromethanopterin reductase-like flavin-dependent oxidoreductase (luciferase family)
MEVSPQRTSFEVAWTDEQSSLLASRTGAQWGVDDPMLMVSAAAAVTKNLAFGITHSVTYGEFC